MYKTKTHPVGKDLDPPEDGSWEPIQFVPRDGTSITVVWEKVDECSPFDMKMELDRVKQRLSLFETASEYDKGRGTPASGEAHELWYSILNKPHWALPEIQYKLDERDKLRRALHKCTGVLRNFVTAENGHAKDLADALDRLDAARSAVDSVTARAERAELEVERLGQELEIVWGQLPDNCEKCHGKRGGVRGNENVVDGKVLCDSCSCDVDRQVEIQPVPDPMCEACGGGGRVAPSGELNATETCQCVHGCDTECDRLRRQLNEEGSRREHNVRSLAQKYNEALAECERLREAVDINFDATVCHELFSRIERMEHSWPQCDIEELTRERDEARAELKSATNELIGIAGERNSIADDRDAATARAEKAEAECERLRRADAEAEETISNLGAERDRLHNECERYRQERDQAHALLAGEESLKVARAQQDVNNMKAACDRQTKRLNLISRIAGGETIDTKEET